LSKDNGTIGASQVSGAQLVVATQLGPRIMTEGRFWRRGLDFFRLKITFGTLVAFLHKYWADGQNGTADSM